jgi:hypothetical protein
MEQRRWVVTLSVGVEHTEVVIGGTSIGYIGDEALLTRDSNARKHLVEQMTSVANEWNPTFGFLSTRSLTYDGEVGGVGWANGFDYTDTHGCRLGWGMLFASM